MNSLIGTFHIDVRLLIAQMINFAIVFSVLYYFVIRPLMKVMKERGTTIEKSLEDAKNIEKKLEDAEVKYNDILIKAKKESVEIIQAAEDRSKKEAEQREKEVKEKIGKIIFQEKENIKHEKDIMFKELKSEVSDLVVESLGVVLGKKIDSNEDLQLIKKNIK